MSVVLPKMHPQRASVASVRLFTIERNGGHACRYTQTGSLADSGQVASSRIPMATNGS